MTTKLTNEVELKAHLASGKSVSRFSAGADLRGAKHIVSVTGVGSVGRTAYFNNHDNDTIMVRAGCFWDTLGELLERSKEEYGTDSDHYKGYKAACNYARVILAQHRRKYTVAIEIETVGE